jgi:hypothetical protein
MALKIGSKAKYLSAKPRRKRRVARSTVFAPFGGHLPNCWPMTCDASGVNPIQREEAMRHAQEIGVPTEFNAEGQAVYTSQRHRKAYLRAIGMYDRNAGYGDPEPINR